MLSFLWGGVLAFLDAIQTGLPFVYSLFKDARVAIGLAVSLFGTGFVLFVFLWLRRFSPVLSDIRRITRQIIQLENASALNKDFNRIDELMNEVDAVRPGWEEFKKHLIFPEEGEGRENLPIRATHSPEYYISVGAAEGKTLHLDFYKGVADYFVGAGLIMTFMGLVAALYFTAQGLESGDIDETRASLTALLSAATFKFITSIAGISTSILFSIGFTLLMGSLHSSFALLAEAVQSKLYFANPESIGFGQYRELKRQTQLFEGMAGKTAGGS